MAESASQSTPKVPASPSQTTALTITQPPIALFLTKLPLEIRRNIYGYVFAGAVMRVRMRDSDQGKCRGCGVVHADPRSVCCRENENLFLSYLWPSNYDVRLTCLAIYHEARSQLASEMDIHIECEDSSELGIIIDVCEGHDFLKFAAKRTKLVVVEGCYLDCARTLGKYFTGAKTIEFGTCGLLPGSVPYPVTKCMNIGQNCEIIAEDIKATVKGLIGYKVRGKVNAHVRYEMDYWDAHYVHIDSSRRLSMRLTLETDTQVRFDERCRTFRSMRAYPRRNGEFNHFFYSYFTRAMRARAKVDGRAWNKDLEHECRNRDGTMKPACLASGLFGLRV